MPNAPITALSFSALLLLSLDYAGSDVTTSLLRFEFVPFFSWSRFLVYGAFVQVLGFGM